MLRLRIVLISLIILALIPLFWLWSTSAFSFPLRVRWALSPEMAARQNVFCPGGTALVPESFRVIATRAVADRTMIFYTASCHDRAGSPPVAISGDALVSLSFMGWRVNSGDSHTSPSGQARCPIENLSANRSFGANPFTVVRGTLGTASSAIVEVVLANGDVVRDQPTSGMFAVYIPQAVEVRDIRLLDDAGQLFHQESFHQPCGSLP